MNRRKGLDAHTHTHKCAPTHAFLCKSAHAGRSICMHVRMYAYTYVQYGHSARVPTLF